MLALQPCKKLITIRWPDSISLFKCSNGEADRVRHRCILMWCWGLPAPAGWVCPIHLKAGPGTDSLFQVTRSDNPV